MAKTETRKMLAAAVAAAQDKQAVDLRVLELDPAESSLTDFFLVMSGTNSRQMQTLADDPQRRKTMGELAHQQAMAIYAWTEKGRKTVEVYDWVLGRRKDKPDFYAPSKL